MSTLHKVKAYFGMAPMDDYDDEYYDDEDRVRPAGTAAPARTASRTRVTTATTRYDEPAPLPRRLLDDARFAVQDAHPA